MPESLFSEEGFEKDFKAGFKKNCINAPNTDRMKSICYNEYNSKQRWFCDRLK